LNNRLNKQRDRQTNRQTAAKTAPAATNGGGKYSRQKLSLLRIHSD